MYYKGDHFTDIDTLEFLIVADHAITKYSENFSTIASYVEKKDFIDKASNKFVINNYYKFSREYKDGSYISRFEVSLPNYKSDVVIYTNEFTVKLVIEGKLHEFSANTDELRTMQDMGILLSTAGLK